jgi:hypothetical protein
VFGAHGVGLDSPRARRPATTLGWALALASILFLLLGAACGGDDDDDSDTTSTSAAPADLNAVELVPDLTGEGFNQTTPERLPNTGELDIAFSIYEHPADPVLQARTEVRVYPSEEIADEDFELQAEGWKNPPPGLFGGDPDNQDAPPLEGLDDAAAYLAANADPQGFRLWTDVYRIGPLIVVAHVLGQDEADVAPVRQAMADAVSAEVR